MNKKAVNLALKLYNQTGDSKYLESGFAFAERNKAGILAESIAEADARKFAGIPDSLLESEKNLRIDLAFFETKLQEAEELNDSAAIAKNNDLLFDAQKKYDDLLINFEKNYPAYHQLKYPRQIRINKRHNRTSAG